MKAPTLAIVLTIAGLIGLTACDVLNTATKENTTVVVDGKTYRLEEVNPPAETTTIVSATVSLTEGTTAARTPVTAYVLIDGTDTYLLYNRPPVENSMHVLSDYWSKDNGVWIFHQGPKPIRFSASLLSYPVGGEFGNMGSQIGSDYTKSIFMADGTVYIMRQKEFPITISADTIRIYNYYEKPTGVDRWYYHSEPLDLPVKSTRIQ